MAGNVIELLQYFIMGKKFGLTDPREIIIIKEFPFR